MADGYQSTSFQFHFLMVVLFLCNWEATRPKKKIHHSSIMQSLRSHYLIGIKNYTHQVFQIQIVLH